MTEVAAPKPYLNLENHDQAAGDDQQDIGEGVGTCVASAGTGLLASLMTTESAAPLVMAQVMAPKMSTGEIFSTFLPTK